MCHPEERSDEGSLSIQGSSTAVARERSLGRRQLRCCLPQDDLLGYTGGESNPREARAAVSHNVA
jgi:hypothetical protein